MCGSSVTWKEAISLWARARAGGDEAGRMSEWGNACDGRRNYTPLTPESLTPPAFTSSASSPRPAPLLGPSTRAAPSHPSAGVRHHSLDGALFLRTKVASRA